LRNLDDEHTEIRCCYGGLEKTILCGRGLPHILAAADRLVKMMLLHLSHEEQLLVKLALSGDLLERHRNSKIEVTSKLFSIETGLKQGSTASVFHLLRLGRFWMKEHMDQENEEFQCEALIRKERTSSRVPGHHRAAVAGGKR
jgi:hemerythrin